MARSAEAATHGKIPLPLTRTKSTHLPFILKMFMLQNFEWISLIEYCFDDLYFNAIYAHEVVYQNIIPSVEKSLERIEEYRLTENIKLKNIEYLYSRVKILLAYLYLHFA